jgi:2'-5' RNA ligase
MRLFLAIAPEGPARRHLAELRRIVSPHLGRATLPPAQNLHVTIKFLGDVADALVPGLCDMLSTIRGHSPVRLRTTSIECFPSRGPIRVVAAGLDGDLQPLHELYRSIEQACLARGFPLEGRAWTPHVTLARVRSPLPPTARQQLADLAAAHLPGPESLVGSFELISSQLTPRGPIYTPAAVFGLGDASS